MKYQTISRMIDPKMYLMFFMYCDANHFNEMTQSRKKHKAAIAVSISDYRPFPRQKHQLKSLKLSLSPNRRKLEVTCEKSCRNS